MRVLFVLSGRRAFRWRRYKHSVVNYAGVSCLTFRCCGSRARAPELLSTRIRPSLMFASPGAYHRRGEATEEARLEDMEASRPCRGREL